jgi:hypothetical protein
MKFISVMILSAILSNAALAGDCLLTIDRTPCPGKESEARKPYDGKNPTDEKMKKATTAEACTKEGEKSSKIVRAGVLAKKHIKISFDGTEIGQKTEEKACN